MSAAATESSGDRGEQWEIGPAERGYLDAASGLPLPRDARIGLAAASARAWPDPARRYPGARESRRLLDSARASVARQLGIRADGVFFPGSAEEACAWALSAFSGRRLLVSAVEHISILRTVDLLQQRGTEVDVLDVDATGRVDPRPVAQAAGAAGPAAVVVHDINIEIGTRQPLDELRTLLPGVPLIVDGRGSLGREPLTPHWDVLLADPRLWGGPGGCAVLAVRDPAGFRPAVPPTDGHGGLEPAEPPVAALAAAALALESSTAADSERLGRLSAHLRRLVTEQIPDVALVGRPDSTWISMFTFLYVAAEEMIDGLGRRGWACASGASCTSDTRRPHHVLTAVGASSHGSLRVSLPPWADEAMIERFVSDLADVVRGVRAAAGALGL